MRTGPKTRGLLYSIFCILMITSTFEDISAGPNLDCLRNQLIQSGEKYKAKMVRFNNGQNYRWSVRLKGETTEVASVDTKYHNSEYSYDNPYVIEIPKLGFSITVARKYARNFFENDRGPWIVISEGSSERSKVFLGQLPGRLSAEAVFETLTAAFVQGNLTNTENILGP